MSIPYVPYQILTAAELNASIDGLTVAVGAEVARAIAAEATISATLTGAIGTEAARAIAVEATLAAGLLTTVSTFTSIAALRAFSGIAHPVAYIEGFHTLADGGGGLFTCSLTDFSSLDNGGTIIVDTLGRRWYRETAGYPLRLNWFGAQPDGSDCKPALLAALAALPSGGGEIHIGAGTWTFASNVSYTYPGLSTVTLTGEGSQATILYWPGNQGLVLNANNPNDTINIRDLAFRAGGSVSGTALRLNQTLPGGLEQNNIVRVMFDSTSGATSWSWGIQVFAWCNINYDAVEVQGTAGGIQVQGDAATPFRYSIIHNFSRCGFYGTSTGIEYSSYVQGVSVSQTNFTNGINGILVPPSAAGDLSELNVSQCQFGVTGSGLNIQGPINEVAANNNLFITEVNGAGINISAPVHFSTFSNNIFPSTTPTGTGGIITNSASCIGCSIIGNVFQGLGTGYALGSGTTNWNIQSNVYNNCTVNGTNTGTGNIIGGGSP